MSEDGDLEALADRVARVLEARAGDIVDAWIEWIRCQVPTGAVRSLPDIALRNHIPPVVNALARYVRRPIELVRVEVLGHLELHGHVRWEQGYGIEELLAEFDGLAQLVSDEVLIEIGQSEASARTAAEIMARVGAGLRTVGHVTVSIYRKTDRDHRREIGRHLDEFARSVSHEVRGPLQAAKLGVSLLSKPEVATDDQQRAEHVQIILRSLARTVDLLDNLRILAIAQSARGTGRQIDLAVALQSLRDELTVPADERDVKLILEGEPPKVRVASVPTQVALMNLVSNAIKYSDPQKAARWVRVTVERFERENQAACCRVTVTDNGLGIPVDMQHSVFQRHVRLHPDVADGTGLGLAITRQLVQQHGGSITLESEIGAGTTVQFTLPVVDIPTGRELTTDDLAEIAGRGARGDPPEEADRGGDVRGLRRDVPDST